MKPVNVRYESGTTLIEALVAILIFSIGILAIAGLQANAVQTTRDAKFRADASFLANQTLGRVWGDPANLSGFVETDTEISDLPDGKRTVEVDGNRVTVTLTWKLPGDADRRNFVVTGYVSING